MRIGALLQWTVLFFLVLESLGLIATTLGLVLRIAHPADVYGSSWGHMSVELVLRIAIVVFILSAYRCLKKVSRLPLILTRQSALLTSRAARSILVASIALYAVTAEKIVGSANTVVAFPAWSLGLVALGTVTTTVMMRRRFLRAADEELRSDPHNPSAVGQWRKITIMSMVLAMSIGLYGFMLRVRGDSQILEWLFLASSIGLLFLWSPRLDSAIVSPANQVSNEANGSFS